MQTKKQESGPNGRKAAKKRNALDVTGLTTIGGNSALALAVRHGHASVVEYLLSQVWTQKGSGSKHVCSQPCTAETSESCNMTPPGYHYSLALPCLLPQQGAVFDLKNPADSSAFHAALDRGAAAVASKLLQYLNSSKPSKGVKGSAPALPAPSSTSSSTAVVVSASGSQSSSSTTKVSVSCLPRHPREDA